MDPESKWKMATIENSELREMGNDADLLLAEPLLAADPGPPQDPLQQVHTNDSPMGVRNGHYEIAPLHVGMPSALVRPLEAQLPQAPDQLDPRYRPEFSQPRFPAEAPPGSRPRGEPPGRGRCG